MLEHSCLVVEGWTSSATSGSAWNRRITDSASHALGFVRLAGKVRSAWFSWLGGTRLEIFETEDASHLMSLVRPWGMQPRWEVYDAEERHVGSIDPSRLTDSEGQCRGCLNFRQRDQGTIFDTENRVLASFRTKTSSSQELAFASEPEANPFLRMLLLGAVLALDPMPGSK